MIEPCRESKNFTICTKFEDMCTSVEKLDKYIDELSIKLTPILIRSENKQGPGGPSDKTASDRHSDLLKRIESMDVDVKKMIAKISSLIENVEL
ncbi:MAG: hypothetical protein PHD05_00480 [Sphaerochaetaceae bacterium]|nr:hypothetical protein [Sphaerochaetaceae bacterium]